MLYSTSNLTLVSCLYHVHLMVRKSLVNKVKFLGLITK